MHFREREREREKDFWKCNNVSPQDYNSEPHREAWHIFNINPNIIN